jgi:hypothetical protein
MGPEGNEFQAAVFLHWHERRSNGRPISRADAIRHVLKRPDFAHLGNFSVRYLEKKLLAAAEHWNPYFHLRKKLRDTIRANYKRN